jgi:hypothetical protein
MTKKTKGLCLSIGAACFVMYTFAASRPIPEETILTSQWFTSLESDYSVPKPVGQGQQAYLVPFKQGNRYGYVDEQGNFALNQARTGYVSIADQFWAEYDAMPERIEIRNPANEAVLSIEQPRGYPLFLDDRIFLVSREQTALSELSNTGEVIWTYNFTSLITTVDAAAGYIVAGLVHGEVEILDSSGNRVSSFDPGGSRIAVIVGCAISKDASRVAIVSGIDPQRFLLLERYGDVGNLEFKAIYHEFLETGTRQAVHVEFVDEERRVAFERQGGLGLYDIASRSSVKLPLEGRIIEIDKSGSQHVLFLITAQADLEKRLVAVRFPGTVIIEAPFKSGIFFLNRRDSRVYIGGNMTLASFKLEKK